MRWFIGVFIMNLSPETYKTFKMSQQIFLENFPHWTMSADCMSFVIGFNHGLPWCVKYMARGPPVTTKPDGEAGGFCGDRRPEGHVFHTSRQAMIKTYYSTSI